jgi:rod shape-determining protein MreD
MNWLAFFILAYLAVGLQSGLASYMRWGAPTSSGAEPNFGLIAVVFVSLNAERQAALLGGFILGAMQDLATNQPVGLFAFCFGLAALFIVSIAGAVYRGHPLTHFVCALSAGSLTSIILHLNAHFRHAGVPTAATFGSAVHTALLAPFLIGALDRIKKLFLFKAKKVRI